ncbi:hypothetical protein [Acetobacterium sp.]|uniref:hypothetical protein n=1 Tax=Acetobacterium sp. TaxID=1872094 RepID=UPI0035945076
MKKFKQLFIVLMVLAVVLSFSGCTQSFSIDGMWISPNGMIITFQNGSSSASLFGFNGGPNGSYELSEKTDSNGDYTLYGSHLTGGTVEYSINVVNNDEIVMTLRSESSYAPNSITLERK